MLRVVEALKARHGLSNGGCFCQDIDPGASGTDWKTQWMVAAQDALVIPCFVDVEYMNSQACVDEFKYAKNRGKLLAIALAPPSELADVRVNQDIGNGPLVAYFCSEQCLLAWPDAPPGDADGSDFRNPEVIASYIHAKFIAPSESAPAAPAHAMAETPVVVIPGLEELFAEITLAPTLLAEKKAIAARFCQEEAGVDTIAELVAEGYGARFAAALALPGAKANKLEAALERMRTSA